jgi:hypothetical protein
VTPIRPRALAALAAAGLLASCATPTPPPPPVTTFARANCVAAPDLAAAVALTPEKQKAVYTITTPVKADTPCLSRPGGPSPYVLYALPADINDKTLMIGGVLEGARIVAPEVTLLDRQGGVARTFRASDYYFRGPVYSVEFTPRAGEAYALVTVDPSRVGQRYDSIAINTSTSSTYAAGTTVSWTSGVDTAQSRTFSYEGSVQATVLDSEAGKRR